MKFSVLPVDSALRKMSVADHRPAAGLFCFHTVKMDEGFSSRPEEEVKAVFNRNIISDRYQLMTEKCVELLQ